MSKDNRRGIYHIDVAVKDVNNDNERADIGALFSYLDKGIDDMEAGRVHTVEDAFRTIRERMGNEFEEEVVEDNLDRFGDAMPDGRLTAPSNGKVYRLREAILLSKLLGRPLTEDEMRQFEI